METIKDTVSIIVPCYKHAEYLPDALDSVLAQTYPHWDCVVVNDASPDDTSRVALAYQQKDKRIQLLELKTNGGLSNARNQGILFTKGTFVLPLDADDKIAPDYLEKSLSVFQQKPHVKVVYTDAKCFGDRTDTVSRPDMDLKLLCRQNIHQPTAMYRRSTYHTTQGYRDYKYGYEDWDFWMQILKRKEDALRIPEPLFFVRVKDDSMIMDLKKNAEAEAWVRKQIKNNNRAFYRKWAPELLQSNELPFIERIGRKLKAMWP